MNSMICIKYIDNDMLIKQMNKIRITFKKCMKTIVSTHINFRNTQNYL